jgi:SMC interacting uncharacterized protein involved in chromosome segregation
MATTTERLGIVEIKVITLDEKIDDLKNDVKEVHNCLDRTGEELKDQLKMMHTESSKQHDVLAAKVDELEKLRNRYTTYGIVALAFAAGAGWIGNPNMELILKFFGL